MARRYRSRYTRKSHTLILILVSAIALLAAWGLWMAWSAIREYQASRDAYDEIILETADRYGVDPALVKAVIWRESRFRPYVRGKAGEIGLMQIMPDKAVVDWAKRFRVPVPNRGALFTPRLNIEIGTWYLGNALRRWSSYQDRLVLALCEYNAGIRRANAWKPNEKNGSVRERITIASTRSYVDAVLDQYEDYKKSWQKKYPLKGNR